MKRIEEVDKSSIIGTGGWLFESYILRHGASADVKMIEMRLAKGKSLSPKECSQLLTKYSLRYWLHVMMSIHHVNRFAIEPLQMFSLLLEYYGLSRQGMYILAQCGPATLPRTNDRNKKAKLDTFIDSNARVIIGNKAVICFDNYNHSWGSAAMKLNRKTHMINMNVTVAGISVMKRDTDQSFVLINGYWRHSIPNKKSFLSRFIEPMINKLAKTQDQLLQETGSGLNYYETARCVKEEIETVPITSHETMDEDEEEEDHFSLDSYRPAFVSVRDTSENLGMAHLMSRIFYLASDVLKTKQYVYVRWMQLCTTNGCE